MRWPTFSILAPLTDRAATLRRMLLSIAHQSYEGRIEIIGVGNRDSIGSELLDVVPDLSIQRTFGDALDAARGDVIGIQSPGSFYLADAFVSAARELVRSPELGIVSGSDIRVQADGAIIHRASLASEPITPWSLLMRRSIPTHGAFAWKAALTNVGRIDDAVREDGVHFWYRATHFAKAAFIPQFTAVREASVESTFARDAKWRAAMQRLVDECASDPKFANEFGLMANQRAELDRRWALLEARYCGNEASVSELFDELYRGSEASTRAFLVRHGFLPRPASDVRPSAIEIPAIDWWSAFAKIDRSAGGKRLREAA